MRFTVAGEAYEVACDDEALCGSIARWTTLLAGSGSSPTRVVLRAHGPGAPSFEVPGEFCEAFETVDDLLPALEGMLYARLARRQPRVAIVHAAVLAKGGRAVLFAGPSGAGKSVLALTLCSRGWTYLSDELAPIDTQGRVVAVPRPVAFDAGEIPPELLARVSRGRTTWTTELPTRGGVRRRVVHVLPERAAPSGAIHEVAAVIRLEPRRLAPPRLVRLRAAESRAFLFGAFAAC